MWNTFDKSKDIIADSSCTVNMGGLDKDALILKAEAFKESNKELSPCEMKAGLMSVVLENAPVVAKKENIFIYEICHHQILLKYFEKLLSNPKRLEIESKVAAYHAECAFTSDVDIGHIAPDWQYLLSKGIPGVIADLEELYEGCADENKSYYPCRIAVYRSVKDLFNRCADSIEAQGGEKAAFIADNFRTLSVSAPKTMAQAMQLILMYYFLQTHVDTFVVRSLGGIDRLLYPFYKSDLESGRYTHDQLTETVKYFLWSISCLKAIANLPFYICGMDKDGKDATNEFTRLLLETYRDLDIYDPKIHVLYHENMDKEVLLLILEMIREGKNSFVFINTDATSKALERIGISSEDAKKITVYGCYETASEGEEVPCTCAGKVNLAKAIEMVMKSSVSFDSFEDFLKDVLAQLKLHTKMCMDTIAGYETLYPEICNSHLMSPTYKNSRESGVDLYHGGAKYNTTSIVGAGMATLVDSLIAVKHVVFDDKIKTLDEFRAILQSDWAEDEKLRLKIKKLYPKFGNNNDEADSLAVTVYNCFADFVNGTPNGRNGVFRCGMFSVDWRAWMGLRTGATPDGRAKKETLSKNLCATLGQDKNGVTAYLKSILKLDSTKVPDGYVADVVLHKSAVKGDDGMTAFMGLLETFMKKGGFSVHFNILSPEALLKAQAEPEKYKNLQIRLCGWNVRFIDLDKAHQDEFILQSSNAM